jgi:hypothetical protein
MLAHLSFFEDQVLDETLSTDISAADFTIYPTLAHLARYERRKPDLGLT